MIKKLYPWILLFLALASIILLILTNKAHHELKSKSDDYIKLQQDAKSLSSLQKEWSDSASFQRSIKRLKSFAKARVKDSSHSTKLTFAEISLKEFDKIISYVNNHSFQIKSYQATKIDNNHLYLKMELLK